MIRLDYFGATGSRAGPLYLMLAQDGSPFYEPSELPKEISEEILRSAKQYLSTCPSSALVNHMRGQEIDIELSSTRGLASQNYTICVLSQHAINELKSQRFGKRLN